MMVGQTISVAEFLAEVQPHSGELHVDEMMREARVLGLGKRVMVTENTVREVAPTVRVRAERLRAIGKVTPGYNEFAEVLQSLDGDVGLRNFILDTHGRSFYLSTTFEGRYVGCIWNWRRSQDPARE